MKLSILPPRTNSYKGTADAVYQNLDFLDQSQADKVLILAGDHIYKMDYRKMLDFHNASKADVTVGVIRVPLQEAHRFGTVCVDATGRIDEFLEKSSQPLSSLASMGIYIFNKDIIKKCLTHDAARTDSPHDFGYAILPYMVNNQDRVFAYEFSGYWQDIGTIKAYYETSMELLGIEPLFNPDDPDWPIFGTNSNTKCPEVSHGVAVTNSLIGPGCKIEGQVENSILSPGVHVEEQAVVKNSIILANTKIGYHSIVDKCILDENVHVGKLCYVGFSGRALYGNGDITVVGKDVVVPPHTGIGRNVRVQPGAKPADFLSRLVASDTSISASTE